MSANVRHLRPLDPAPAAKGLPLFPGVLEVRVEPGRYIVAFADYRVMNGWGRQRWLCAFKIIDFPLLDDPKNSERQRVVDERRRVLAPFLGVHVPRLVSMPSKDGIRSMRSNFAQDWLHITGRRAPRELPRFKPSHLYSGCTLEVEVGDVDKASDKRQLHADDRYSVVREVVKLWDGSPPCMRGGKA